MEYTTVVYAWYWQGNCSDLCPSNLSSNGFVMLLLEEKRNITGCGRSISLIAAVCRT